MEQKTAHASGRTCAAQARRVAVHALSHQDTQGYHMETNNALPTDTEIQEAEQIAYERFSARVENARRLGLDLFALQSKVS